MFGVCFQLVPEFFFFQLRRFYIMLITYNQLYLKQFTEKRTSRKGERGSSISEYVINTEEISLNLD